MTVATTGPTAASYAGRELWGAFIGGAFVEAGDAGTFAVMEPATGRQLARVVTGGADLVDQAVAVARRAYGPGATRPLVSGAGCCGWRPPRSART